jgi:signal transduction histidine kinase
MIDLQTLIISLLIVEGLLSILMILTATIQKNYPGFTIWSISLVSQAISSLFLFLRGVIPDILSILFTNLLAVFGLVLMAESLHRFYTDTRLNRGYYLILIPVAVLDIYFTLADDRIEMRSLVISVSSVLVILAIIRIIWKNAPKGSAPALYLSLALMAFAIEMGVRGTEWILNPYGRSVFEVSVFNVGLYIVAIITILTITFMYLLINFQRLAEELNDSHLTTTRLVTDLEARNRDLEQATLLMRDLNLILDQKVQDRTEEIRNLLLQKDHFINQVAHDLRTPLTPLVALIPLLREDICDPESARLIDILDKNVNNMRHMTEQLVKLANLNCHGSITDFQEVNLAAMIQDAVWKNSDSIRDQVIVVEMNVPPDLTICISKLFGFTIFSNIINNAVRYNVREGRITITAAEKGGTVSVSFADTGIGMKKEVIDKIWDELYISDPSRSDPGSKGFGLSMVRKIVSLHGGEVTASSPGPGMGSVVVVRLKRSCPGNKPLPTG